MEAIIWLL